MSSDLRIPGDQRVMQLIRWAPLMVSHTPCSSSSHIMVLVCDGILQDDVTKGSKNILCTSPSSLVTIMQSFFVVGHLIISFSGDFDLMRWPAPTIGWIFMYVPACQICWSQDFWKWRYIINYYINFYKNTFKKC